jgi:hypothetical protein
MNNLWSEIFLLCNLDNLLKRSKLIIVIIFVFRIVVYYLITFKEIIEGVDLFIYLMTKLQ